MLKANFFYKFFKPKQKNSYKIIKYNSNEKYNLQEKIYINIQEIDQKISENSKALLQSKLVQLKYNFSRSNNFLDQIGKNLYKTKLDDSIDWHQKQLQELYVRRKKLQINLEKLKGIFWLNQIKRILTIVFIGIFLLLGLVIFLSGFMIIIYLLPIILLIFASYLIANKKY